MSLFEAVTPLRARAWSLILLVLCTGVVPFSAGATEPEPVLLAGGPKFKVPPVKKPGVGGAPTLQEATQQARSKTGPPYDTQTRQQIEKSKRSYERLAQEHEQKLAEYRSNPAAYDNKGLLRDQPPEVQKQIIAGRIKELEAQIARHRNEVRKIEEALRALPSEK